MKTRNIDLDNTPLLINNICKYIVLEAPSLSELKKKVKEYELLLIRVLTNAYKLSSLCLDKNGSYTILQDGNYQSAIYLNFSGRKKSKIAQPETTLKYVKHLTAMESKKTIGNINKKENKQKIKDFHKTFIVPIQLKPEDEEIDAISNKQRLILEQLITDTNLTRISFLKEKQQQNYAEKTKTIFLKVDYDYREIIEIQEGYANHDEEGNR